jgi:hypothetical protein
MKKSVITAGAAAIGITVLAPPAAVACQAFRSATSTEVKANPNGTDLSPLKTYGTTLIKAGEPLHAAKPDPDSSLVSALNLAGAANLAIAVGYEPGGVSAAFNAADKDVNAVGADCTALGY